jgi:hypothetical protein
VYLLHVCLGEYYVHVHICVPKDHAKNNDKLEGGGGGRWVRTGCWQCFKKRATLILQFKMVMHFILIN